MPSIQCRFGEIEYDEHNLLSFPQGLIGFEELRHFVVIPNDTDSPLFWIQSVEDGKVALPLIAPDSFFADYQVPITDATRQILDIDAQAEVFVLAVATVHPDHKVTLNLAAPILFAPQTNRAVQVVLEGSAFDMLTPLPTVADAAP